MMAGPLTEQAEAALIRLYEQAKYTTDNFILERIERALDEIIRLNSSDPATWQVRSAMANASKVIQRRRRIVSPQSLEDLQVDIAIRTDAEEIVELREWLHGASGVSDGQRKLLSSLADGKEAVDLAAHHCISLARMREQVSRARRAARAAYHNDTSAA